jgi:hypothetical protein
MISRVARRRARELRVHAAGFRLKDGRGVSSRQDNSVLKMRDLVLMTVEFRP